MDESLSDPISVAKEPELIKEAQADLAQVDVLVCGSCHNVYHFLEEFKEHKTSEKCKGVSSLKCENEEKTQVWGFTLWKAKELKTIKETEKEISSPWEIYQRWVKLSPNEKHLWVTAGESLQNCHRVSSAKLQEVNNGRNEKDPLALDEVESEPHDSSKPRDGDEVNKNSSKSAKRGVRTSSDNDKEEFIVEKIVGKRFNPRKRLWEYEVKWENYENVTWEPLMNLENCKDTVNEYEAKLKEEKEKLLKEKGEKTPGRGRGRPRVNQSSPVVPVKIIQKKTAVVSPSLLMSSPGGRPQRTSKQKALNQVKAWCGNIADVDDLNKRSHDNDTDDDEIVEKKIKLDLKESESEETDEDPLPIKRMAKIVHSYNNGVGKVLPGNVLIPDAKGVVRISKKQAPSLRSGVYIMSRSSGVIKLDSAASKIAASSGQTILQVGSKVGQTQIKILKKTDGNKTKTLQMKTESPSKPTQIVQQANKTPKKEEKAKKEPIQTPPVVKSILKENQDSQKGQKLFEDESDDGIEDFEFPKDLPLPTPDSPPGDFVLDPFTGKIAGKDYPEPEPEPIKKDENEDNSATETIDNIVKLAAVDITEEDLQPDVTLKPVPPPLPTVPEPIVSENNTKPVETVTPTKVVDASNDNVQIDQGQSLLSKAIINSNILQKTLQTPIPTAVKKVQPRVLNQIVATPHRQTVSPVVRQVVTKVGVPRPKPNILPRKYVGASPSHQMKTVYTKTNNVPRKIGNTTVYRSSPKTNTLVKHQTKVQQSITSVRSVVREKPMSIPSSSPSIPAIVTHTPTLPKPVINMPSLTVDEEPAAVLVPSNLTAVASASETELTPFALADGDRPMFITGDDGTVYQVAGQNEEGQTILLTQDSDGQQQCLLVTNEAVQETPHVNPTSEVSVEVQEPMEIGEEQPVVAQFIRTEPPSPGGTHKVVVMLPDGNVMVTQVTPEEYASLELEK